MTFQTQYVSLPPILFQALIHLRDQHERMCRNLDQHEESIFSESEDRETSKFNY